MTESIHPYPVQPRDGAVVNGIAAEFAWASPGGDIQHHLQISASERFDTLMIDTEVGNATSLTLFGLLPRDGRRLYWRVSTHRREWSDAAWFLAGEGARPAAATARAAAAVAAVAPSRPAVTLPPDAPLYMTAVTGTREIGIAFVVLAAVVLFLVIALTV